MYVYRKKHFVTIYSQTRNSTHKFRFTYVVSAWFRSKMWYNNATDMYNFVVTVPTEANV